MRFACRCRETTAARRSIPAVWWIMCACKRQKIKKYNQGRRESLCQKSKHMVYLKLLRWIMKFFKMIRQSDYTFVACGYAGV